MLWLWSYAALAPRSMDALAHVAHALRTQQGWTDLRLCRVSRFKHELCVGTLSAAWPTLDVGLRYGTDRHILPLAAAATLR